MEILKKAYDKRSDKVNKIEKMKKLRSPLEAYEQLETYAKNGYDSILDEDKSFFLKCFGIYDKKATPNEFMMRIRISGGQLTYEQAMVLGEVAKEYGQDHIDLTTRAQVELRFLNIENIPTLLKKLNSAGITSYQTGVDNFRGIVTDPLDKLGFDNILPSYDILAKIQSHFLHNKDWIATLPRKFNTSISGSITNKCNVYGHDCCFVLAQKNGLYGYNMYLGGKVGKVAKNADIFLKNEEEVLCAYKSITELYKTYGFRDNRNRNRLFFLIESVGIEAVSATIREHSGMDFLSAGHTLTTMDNSDSEQGKVPLKDGSFALHVIVPAGVFSGSDMIEATTLSKKYGGSGIRLDIEQNLYLMNVDEKKLPTLLEEEFFSRYNNIASPYENHLIACAGEKHCSFGVIPNKPDAVEMAQYLAKKVPLDCDSKIRMYWSGCVKGCGIHTLGDIGFEGCKAKVDGVNEYGVHIFLGGYTSGESVEGHSVLKTVPLRFARFYVESLALEYKRMKKRHESFENFYKRVLVHYSHAAIGFMMILQAYIRKYNLDINIGFKENIRTGKNENFEIFDMGRVLHKSLMKEEPYAMYEDFTPKPLNKLEKINAKKLNIDDDFAQMIYDMLKEKNRAMVFSELQEVLLAK